MGKNKEESEKKVPGTSWGGAREGAGRPSGIGSRLYTFRASGDLAEFIDAQENKTEFIKASVCAEMKRCRAGLEECRTEMERLGRWGEVFPAGRVREMRLPYFDIGLVAGFPIPLDNDEKAREIELLRMLCPHPDASYLIRVEGNSMIDAGIFSGDIVIVDKSNRNPSESQVAVCEFNGEYTLKRFMKREGFGWLVPANPDFPEIRVTPEDEFSIWGTVTYIIHKPRNGSR